MLTWQGQATGPHTLREIKSLLRVGKIHSLFKIQVDGEWLLLRDHLADLDRYLREAERAPAVPAATPATRTFPPISMPSGGVPMAIPVPDDDRRQVPEAALPPPRPTAVGEPETVAAKGMGIAAFALSLFFFVPYLNGITWVLALIFGHLAVAPTGAERRSLAGTLAWLGLWLCYVEISLFLLVLGWFLVRDIPVTNLVYLVLHGRMLFSVLAAVIGAGVLMLVVRLTTGTLLAFATCFVAALVTSATGTLGMLLVQTAVPPDALARDQGLVLIGAVNIVLFLVQLFFWGSFIRLPDGGKLGLPRAALVSLPYTVIFAFVGIAELILFAARGG
jgi:hypothetical protein